MADKKERSRPHAGFSWQSFLKNNKPTLKAFGIFVISIIFFFYILISHILDKYFVYPFTSLVAHTSAVILDLVSFDITVNGTILKSPGTSLNIGTGCNGLEAVIIFISAILAFPAGLKNKLLGLLLGFVGIFMVNQTRVVGLYLVSRYSSQYLDLAHTYIGQTYVIISGVALWILWAERVSNLGKKTSPPPA